MLSAPPVPTSLPINKTHLPIWQQVSKGQRIDGAIETSVQPQYVSTRAPFSFQIIEFCGNRALLYTHFVYLKLIPHFKFCLLKLEAEEDEEVVDSGNDRVVQEERRS